jgi:putative ABC transport system permease protein
LPATSWYQLANHPFRAWGRFITESDNESRRRVVVLGDKARADLKLPENPLGTFIPGGQRVVQDRPGVMEARGELFGQSLDNYVVIPFETGWALAAGPYNQPDMAIMVTVDDLDAITDVTSRITVLLRRAHKIGAKDPDDFKVESSQSLTETIGACRAPSRS